MLRACANLSAACVAPAVVPLGQVEVNAERPAQRPKLKDMDAVQRKAYDRERQAKLRARKKASRAQAQEQEQKEVGAACEWLWRASR